MGDLKFSVIIYCLLWKKLYVLVDSYSGCFFFFKLCLLKCSLHLFSISATVLLTFVFYGLC